MSIRGIDTQMMITRATETVKDASELQKHPQINQEAAAERAKEESVHRQSSVEGTQETENPNIDADEDGSGSGAAGGGGRGRGEEDGEDEAPELLVAPSPIQHIVDIVV